VSDDGRDRDSGDQDGSGQRIDKQDNRQMPQQQDPGDDQDGDMTEVTFDDPIPREKKQR